MSFSAHHTPKSSQGSEGDIFFEATPEVGAINGNMNQKNQSEDSNADQFNVNKNEFRQRDRVHDHSRSIDSVISPMQSVYMTPQDSTCNLLINAIKQAAMTNHIDPRLRPEDITTSPTTTPFFTTPSTPFGPGRQTMDFSNVNEFNFTSNTSKSIMNRQVSAAAVAAKIREFESIIKKTSQVNLKPIMETSESPKYSSTPKSNQSSSGSPRYRHAVEPSSGTNTYVADSYDHIEIEKDTITSSGTPIGGSPIEQVNVNNRFSGKSTDERWFTSSEITEDDRINKDNHINLTLNTNSRNKRDLSRDVILEETTDTGREINREENYRRISKVSYATRGDTASKSDSTTEVGGIDSPISSKRVSEKDTFSPISSKTSSKRISKESAVLYLNSRDKFLLLTGLSLAFFLVIFDITMVANQIPKIITDFKSGEDISWIITSYNIASVILQPVCDKYSSIFGRKLVSLIAIFIFGSGSVLSGAAQNIQWLICARALVGLGSGIIVPMAFTTISDVVPALQRKPFNNSINFAFAFGLVLGPIVGGLFSDYLSWRWSFYMNGVLSVIPIISLWFVTILFAPIDPVFTKLKLVDWLGFVLLASGFLFILLPINFGGVQLDWLSIPIFIMFAIGFILLLVFVIFEVKHAEEPLLPKHLFFDSCHRAVFGTFFSLGWIQAVIIYYTPVYFQYVLSLTAISSAIALLPLVVSIVVFLGFSDSLLNFTGYYRWIIFCGSLITIAGSALLSTFNLYMGDIFRIISLVVIGIGIGSSSRILFKPAQMAVKDREKNAVNELCNFFRASGWVFGVSISGAIFNNKIMFDFSNIPNFPLQSSLNDALFLTNIRNLSSKDQILILTSISDAITIIFRICIFMAVIGLVFSLFIKHYKLRGVKRNEQAELGVNNVEVLNEKV
ncbi:major facilitator superfamily domain-containing protein [Gigaspora rosea]|uniref:Major facilitator superfamily domain-containing protein n=1 Tax=Gigaspora rosea TaxID=44941 RepID=A0A397UA23_9GLOM|nr:major facilitator superfamily domain-containing protein [Gigaspora rosea]CAG8474362.1 6027_t:CDS:2 [Gigaspora rosea]